MSVKRSLVIADSGSSGPATPALGAAEMAAAKAAFNAGDDETAAEGFLRALAAGAPEPDCRLHLGRIYNRSRDWTQALEQWRWLRDRDELQLEPQLQVARCHLRLGAPLQAVSGFAAVLRLAPDHPEARQQLPKALLEVGTAAFNRGDYEGAETSFRAALEAGAEAAECRLHLARVYNQQRDWERALEQWQWLRKHDPPQLEPQLQTARALLRLGRNAEAAAGFAAVLRLAPDHPEARARLAEKKDLKTRLATYSTLVGDDGWLFMNGIDRLFEKHTGKVTLSPEQQHHWQLTLELRDAWITRRGGHYYFMVAPSKASIYGRHLPPEFAESPCKPLRLLKAQLEAHSDIRIVDPSERLIALSAQTQVYYRTDEHWNHFGALCAYRQLVERINEDVALTAVDEQSFTLRERAFIGELSVILANPYQERSLFGSLRDPGAQVVYENKVTGRGKMQIHENRDRSLPRAVIFRDSYANALLPLLAESFSRIVSVGSQFLHFDLIESEQPDVVITELAERYLDPAPDDIRCPSIAAYCGVTLEEIREKRLST